MTVNNSFRFFANTDCQYYPCHKGAGDAFNCLFCYCPLYALGDRCGGNYEYLPDGVKSCMNCTIPHTEKGFEYIMSKIGGVTELAKENRHSEPHSS